MLNAFQRGPYYTLHRPTQPHGPTLHPSLLFCGSPLFCGLCCHCHRWCVPCLVRRRGAVGFAIRLQTQKNKKKQKTDVVSNPSALLTGQRGICTDSAINGNIHRLKRDIQGLHCPFCEKYCTYRIHVEPSAVVYVPRTRYAQVARAPFPAATICCRTLPALSSVTTKRLPPF